MATARNDRTSGIALFVIIGFTCPPTICFKFITKYDKCYYKVRQLFYYKVRQVLSQSATGITKCDSTNHQQLSDPTTVSLHFNQAGHSINAVTQIPLELIRSNRDAVRKARGAHLILKGNTLSPPGITRIAERRFLTGLQRGYFFCGEGAAIHAQATIKLCRQPLHATESHVRLKHKLVENIVPFLNTFVTKKKEYHF